MSKSDCKTKNELLLSTVFQLVVLKVIHTFTDKDGEFVFGPLCDNKFYEVQVWANDVKLEFEII